MKKNNFDNKTDLLANQNNSSIREYQITLAQEKQVRFFAKKIYEEKLKRIQQLSYNLFLKKNQDYGNTFAKF